MKLQRVWIYGGFVALWGLSAIVLGLHASTTVASVPDRSILIESRSGLSKDASQSSVIELADPAEPFSVMIYREPRGKRKLEPQADCTEWQVIFRWALMAC